VLSHNADRLTEIRTQTEVIEIRAVMLFYTVSQKKTVQVSEFRQISTNFDNF